MQSRHRARALVLLAAATGMALSSVPAAAETPFEKSQREDMEHYQQQHGVSPQVAQTQRWEREWKQQHPNEPVPNSGVLAKLHRQELITNMNRGFADMRRARQRQLQAEYQMARQYQQRQLDAQHVIWSPQQWQRWNEDYNREHQQRAQEYLEAARAAAGGPQTCAKGLFDSSLGGCIGSSGKVLDQTTGKPMFDSP